MRQLALIALVVLLLAACHRDSDKAGARGQVVNLAYATLPDTSLVRLALDRGFFAAEGLVVNAKPFAFGKLALASVLGGSSDLATVAETPFVLAIMAGEKLSISAVIASSDRNMAVVASESQGVTLPSDLVGKAIGVPLGTNGEYFLDAFLIARGIEKRSVRIVDLQPDQMLHAIQSGRIAAAVAWNPTLLHMKNSLAGKGRVFDGEDFYTASFCIAGTQDFVSKHPEAMRAFLRALISAEAFMTDNPVQARAMIGKDSGSDEASLATILDAFKFRVGIDKSFLLVLEDEINWVIRSRTTSLEAKPDILGFIDSEALSSVAPERVRYIK
jgi:NitT/TauT family transport system substrate-binding protein